MEGGVHFREIVGQNFLRRLLEALPERHLDVPNRARVVVVYRLADVFDVALGLFFAQAHVLVAPAPDAVQGVERADAAQVGRGGARA